MVRCYYFRFVSAVLKMRENGCLHYYTLLCGKYIQSYYIYQRYVRVTCLFTSAAVKSVLRLTKVHFSEKAEVDIISLITFLR